MAGIVLKDFVVQQAAPALRQGNFCVNFEEAINLGGSYYQVWKRAAAERERRQIGLKCKSTKISPSRTRTFSNSTLSLHVFRTNIRQAK